jgi:urease accessory protein
VGARATRITRDEFVTPPEFADFVPTQNPSGRVGGVRLELISVDGKTCLGTCYQQIPTRVFPPFALDREPASLLYLINLTAGLMDGDAHLFEISAREGTRAVVTGQSATRVHPALESHSTQQWVVQVGNDACLVVLPGPAIPFRGCRYYQRGRVELAPSARLIWGDIWLPGRYDRGALSERFQFERIVQDFEVRRNGRFVYRDRFRWDGPWTSEEAVWYFGENLASASLFLAGPTIEAHELPESGQSMVRSVFRLDADLTCIRWCGPPAAVTADFVRTALVSAASWTDGPGAPPWLLASGSLAPNHWFSTPVDDHRPR